MKASLLLTSTLTVLLVSCSGGHKKDNVITIMPQVSPAFKQAEHRCQLNGEFERKDVYLKTKIKDGHTVVSFHDFISADQYSKELASFEGFTLPVFKITAQKDKKNQVPFSSGADQINHQDLVSLSPDGEVIKVMAKLTLYKDMQGFLQQKQTIKSFNKALPAMDTPYMHLAKIENCEKSEASSN